MKILLLFIAFSSTATYETYLDYETWKQSNTCSEISKDDVRNEHNNRHGETCRTPDFLKPS